MHPPKIFPHPFRASSTPPWRFSTRIGTPHGAISHPRRHSLAPNAGGAQCGVHQSIEIPRWTISVGAEPLGALHRDTPGGQDYREGSRVTHQCERGTIIPSLQDRHRCYSRSLHHDAARRARMHDVDYNAGAACPASTRVRILRPGASLQTVSPQNRHAPIGLASRDDSPIRRSGRLRKGLM